MRDTDETATLLRTGLILGIGLAGTLDEVVLHQLLGWHSFLSGRGPAAARIGDGLFHLLSSGLLVWGALRLWRGPLPTRAGGRALAAGVLIGAGGFNLYDGIVQHKLLGLHPVRVGAPDPLPYDLAFTGVALALLLAGLALRRGLRRAG